MIFSSVAKFARTWFFVADPARVQLFFAAVFFAPEVRYTCDS